MARGPLAGAAGPGKFSKRTDLPSEYYGEGIETSTMKSGAPLASTRGVADNVGGRPVGAPAVSAPVTELFAPSQRPEEPITAGINMGAGPGADSLMMQSNFAQRKMSDILAEMIPYDTTGEIQYLYQNALSRGN
jgi:hypothetical protein